ncbi:16850_t:CDS:2, partial [Gigaspora margarita]
YRSPIPNQIPQTSAINIQNKSHSDSSGPQFQQRRIDSVDYPRVPDKYLPERPPDRYGVNSERFIYTNLINPTPSTSQIMETLANNLYKKLLDIFSAKLIQSKKKDTSPITDDVDEITKDRS